AREREPAVGVALPDPVARRIDDVLQPRLAAANHFLREIARTRRLGLAQRRPDGRDEPVQVVLQYVAGCPALQRLDRALLADRAGDEDERRRRRLLYGDAQRGQAVEAWQREVREDDLRRELDDRAAKRELVGDHPARGREAVGRQPPRDELGL